MSDMKFYEIWDIQSVLLSTCLVFTLHSARRPLLLIRVAFSSVDTFHMPPFKVIRLGFEFNPAHIFSRLPHPSPDFLKG